MVLAVLSPDVAWKLGFVAIIAEISLIGVISTIWGLSRVRRSHFRWGAYQRLIRDLVAWRIIEEDPTGEYQQAEPVAIAWAHGQGLSAILGGLGVVAAGMLTSFAILLVPISSLPADTRSAFHTVPRELLVLLLIYIQLLVVGMLGGIILGYTQAFRRSEAGYDSAPTRPRFGVSAYRAPWLPWLVTALVALESAVFALSVPSSFWHSKAAQIVALLALPGIAMGEIVLLEVVARTFCRMPLALMAGSPKTPDHQAESLYAFLVTVIFGSQVSMPIFLVGSQLLALAWAAVTSSSALALPAPLGYAVLVETFGGMALIGFLGKTGGRLGGSTTGWPWHRALGTAPE